jgi:hypothetical protein
MNEHHEKNQPEVFCVTKIFCASMPDWFCFFGFINICSSASKNQRIRVELTVSAFHKTAVLDRRLSTSRQGAAW